MRLRSLLFVPGDRPERFAKAAASGADVIILDLEDSVAPAAKPKAREHVAAWLASGGAAQVQSFVRVNPLGGGETEADVAALNGLVPDAIVLPKAEGAASIAAFDALWGEGAPKLLPIATETPAAIFELGSYRQCSARLAGLSWGAEDLPAAIGATAAREADGRYTPPMELARALALFGAHAAVTAAIETVFPAFGDLEDLTAHVARARRDGFMGMLAIHPAQVAVINAGFTPSEDELAHARAVIAAFDANPQAGALQLDGKMIDRPHLIQARRLVARG